MSERALGTRRVGGTVLLALLVGLAILPDSVGSRSHREAPRGPANANQLPRAEAGRDLMTYAGQPTRFAGHGASPDGEIVAYEWDFNGDGRTDVRSTQGGTAWHAYAVPGTYQAMLRVYDDQGRAAADAVTVLVVAGAGPQAFLPGGRLQALPGQPPGAPGDGLVERYAVLINGGYETRFWEDVTFLYSTLTADYGFSAGQIWLLNHDGTDPGGTNPGGMIDGPATLANLDAAFAALASTMDGDDEILVWVTDHGQGYNGPQLRSYGYLGSRASVQPGDEQDYPESDFKLRALCTYGDYAVPTCNHGLGVFRVYRRYSSAQGAYQVYRNKFVSSFNNLSFEGQGLKSDGDVYIERLVDYLLGDTDRDGYVETAQGETLDFDGDGVPPYDPATGSFDEDDWGDLDWYEDNFNNINTAHPGDTYLIFDHGFDNHLDIDFDYDPAHLEVDGTDLDNQGLFDGIDVNQDGDLDDWVSIDEAVTLWQDALYDDELATLLDRIPSRRISVVMEPCFSGGFVDDLSAAGRVISTATEEETVSYGNLFVELFTTAFHRASPEGTPVDADSDGNGQVSMREAFSYAAGNDTLPEVPQYDDNGDGLSHPYPIPQGGDGELGASVYLANFYALALEPHQDATLADAGQTITYTLSLTNQGSLADTYDVAIGGNAWPASAPPTVGPLAAAAGADFDLIVSLPASALPGTQDRADLTVASQGDGTLSATATLITTVRSVHDVRVSPTVAAHAGDPGQTVTYTLQVTNTGNVADTFQVTASDHAWPLDLPEEVGPLAPEAGTTLVATVGIPPGAAAGATDTVTLTLTSLGDGTQSTTATLTTTANPVHGLALAPATDARSGDPGGTVTYTLQVTNTGNTTDTFSLTIDGQAWPTSGPDQVGPLAAGAAIEMDITVTIPAQTIGGATDLATVTLDSLAGGAPPAVAVLTTTANRIYGLTVTPTLGLQAGDPGETVTYTLRVTNTGNAPGTFQVTASGHAWPLDIPGAVGPLAPGEGRTLAATVGIPPGAAAGATDTVTLTLTSLDDDAQSATATLTTTANAVHGVALAPVTDARSGDPGGTVTYTLRVTNTGNTTGTFGVTIDGQAWQTSGPAHVGPLAAGETIELDITVTIPAQAVGGMTDVATVTLTSSDQAGAMLLAGSQGLVASRDRRVRLPSGEGRLLPAAGSRPERGWASPFSTSREGGIDTPAGTGRWNAQQAGSAGAMRDPSPEWHTGAGTASRTPIWISAPGGDLTTGVAASTTDPVPSASATLTTTVNAVYGVLLETTAAAQLGAPGRSVTYTLQVTNSGGLSDLLYLAFVATHAWEISLSATGLALEPGQGAEIHLFVLIPLDARPVDRNTVTVTATSRGNPSVASSLALVTTVTGRVFLPLVIRGDP